MPNRRAILALIPVLLFTIWYRAHTFGPTLRDSIGVNLWPACIGATEPLDCDEAIYAYIGHRMLQGDVMYRDLTENKPPLGYWLYELAVAIGGYNETAIRVMPLIPVLATLVLIWWIASTIRGIGTGLLAGFLFVLLSTDPYLFGNGGNMEHFMNLFGVASLALFMRAWNQPGIGWFFLSGLFLGAEILVKQVAITHALVFAMALAYRHFQMSTDHNSVRERRGRVARNGLIFGLGLVGICGLAALVLIVQGAGKEAYEDIFRYGPALATDTLPEPNAPSALIRWFTGNADPSGKLPWPFGVTDYLVWWGTGSWPMWLVGIPAALALGFGKSSTPHRRLVSAWTFSCMPQVLLPGLYWPHYYLLPVPGLALVVAIWSGDLVTALRSNPNEKFPKPIRLVGLAGSLIACSLAIMWTAHVQIRDYLRVAPEELTIRYKGGRQWVVLRQMGRDLARRSHGWKDPRLFVWGWQSPLYFYSKIDSMTPHVFTDNLLRDQAGRNHPLIKPRTEAIVEALTRKRPQLVFTGYPPFAELDAVLKRDYLPSRIARGLWVDRTQYGRFETFGEK